MYIRGSSSDYTSAHKNILHFLNNIHHEAIQLAIGAVSTSSIPSVIRETKELSLQSSKSRNSDNNNAPQIQHPLHVTLCYLFYIITFQLPSRTHSFVFLRLFSISPWSLPNLKISFIIHKYKT